LISLPSATSFPGWSFVASQLNKTFPITTILYGFYNTFFFMLPIGIFKWKCGFWKECIALNITITWLFGILVINPSCLWGTDAMYLFFSL
jgi:hypothetical protein